MSPKLFKRLTLRDKFITYFNVLGYRLVDTKFENYLCYSNGSQYIFLDNNGDVRVNSKKSPKKTVLYTDQWQRVMENWAIQQGYEL